MNLRLGLLWLLPSVPLFPLLLLPLSGEAFGWPFVLVLLISLVLLFLA